MFAGLRKYPLVDGVYNNVAVMESDEDIRVMYHKTIIFKYNRVTKLLTLNTGGYKTHSTKVAINRALEQMHFGGAYLYQKNFQWFLDINGTTHEMDETLEVQVD